jgi:hypothetical protein
VAAVPSYCPQQGAEVLRWSRRQENCGGCRGLFNPHPAAIHGFWRELVKSVRFWNGIVRTFVVLAA